MQVDVEDLAGGLSECGMQSAKVVGIAIAMSQVSSQSPPLPPSRLRSLVGSSSLCGLWCGLFAVCCPFFRSCQILLCLLSLLLSVFDVVLLVLVLVLSCCFVPFRLRIGVNLRVGLLCDDGGW